MKPINWNQLFDSYKGKWVALEQNKKTVVSSGKNAKTVFEKAKKKGVKVPTLVKVPTKMIPFAG